MCRWLTIKPFIERFNNDKNKLRKYQMTDSDYFDKELDVFIIYFQSDRKVINMLLHIAEYPGFWKDGKDWNCRLINVVSVECTNGRLFRCQYKII